MGIDLNIIFMGYTILSILCFIRTILFMPKITFPFTIPDGYDYGYCEIIQNKVTSKKLITDLRVYADQGLC